MTPLFSTTQHAEVPHISQLAPPAAMPGGSVLVAGSSLLHSTGALSRVTIGDVPAHATLSRPAQTLVRVPEGAISGNLVIHHRGGHSNPVHIRVAVPMAENLHPVANPAVDADGQVYATFSGSRGQTVAVSIFRIQSDFQVLPFVRDILNPSGLAFDRSGYLYTSSRADGTVYRISPEGAISTYAEGLGLATGLAFDDEGSLFVGDRSGTIFKIDANREIFVFATLEPSVAAYHLAFNSQGRLFVTGPTTSSNQAIHAIDRDGSATVFYQGLGRAQGFAFDRDDNLYVAASLHGQRGIVRVTPRREASVAVSGNNLVGMAFLEDGCAALATRDALYHVALDIEGRKLI